VLGRCLLPPDPPRTPCRFNQEVLQELPATQQQIGQGRSGHTGFSHPDPALLARATRSSLSSRPMLAAIAHLN